MARRRLVRPRRRIFVAAEGDSERSFARLLSRLCGEAGLRLHLDIHVCGGGDSRAVVEFARKHRDIRAREYGLFSAAFVLLDSDRMEQDRRSGRGVDDTGNLALIRLRPNLVRCAIAPPSRSGNPSPAGATNGAGTQKLWPDYQKPASADALEKRFSLADFQRAARHDDSIRLLLEQLGLPGSQPP